MRTETTRTARSDALARRCLSVLALAALLAQPVLPHVHARQDAAHAAPERALGTLVADAAAWVAAVEDEAACPVCRALASARAYVAPTTTCPAPAAPTVATSPGDTPRQRSRATVRHAPRSPPLSA